MCSIFKGYTRAELNSALASHRKLLQFWKDNPSALGAKDSAWHHKSMIDTLLAMGAH